MYCHALSANSRVLPTILGVSSITHHTVSMMAPPIFPSVHCRDLSSSSFFFCSCSLSYLYCITIVMASFFDVHFLIAVSIKLSSSELRAVFCGIFGVDGACVISYTSDHNFHDTAIKK